MEKSVVFMMCLRCLSIIPNFITCIHKSLRFQDLSDIVSAQHCHSVCQLQA